MLDKKIGVIAPAGACGHFIYAIHNGNSFSISDTGDCHSQKMTNHDFELSHTVHRNFQKNFIAHWKDDVLTRNYYPDHYLISVQPEPYNVLLVAYLMTVKAVIPNWNQSFHYRYFDTEYVEYRDSFYDYTDKEKYEIFSLNVVDVNEYKYKKVVDKQYGIDDIFLNFNDSRYVQYTLKNQRHFTDCVKFVEGHKHLSTPSSKYTKVYYNLAKKFSKILDKIRE